ncbi:trypsin-like peptidase domain-containing protein [Comamonas endophytica]|uniref:Serine protease n=1 Tax=Comamonas endophytica TaxID=2949090 RepID=A0ABY6GE71_9BURK|nr:MULTISPECIES: trypsin-like peptidase domain-containing protein [unclassified Acidovorax]MCD2513258.1 serine protease [Acidovorax sp. D4N7]UYG53399.1 serine protease [Acidovorax sp. 5MLIR]
MSIAVETTLTCSTVRIETPETGATGTGFFYRIHFGNNIAKQYIATNRHVVKGATFIDYVLTTASDVSQTSDSGAFVDETHHLLRTSLGKYVDFSVPISMDILIPHPDPDPDVDLVLIDVTIPIGIYLASRKLRIASLDRSWLPKKGDRALRSIEPLKIIGYPIGMWDEHNNMPIARSGSTATHPLASFNGDRNFLVDGAVFAGSSGSPVFGYESPMYLIPNGGFTPGTKAVLLGILWGVMEADTLGEMVIDQIPAAKRRSPQLKTSLHLGVALHADRLLEIEEFISPGVTSESGTNTNRA